MRPHPLDMGPRGAVVDHDYVENIERPHRVRIAALWNIARFVTAISADY
jgi:hypothetical protein